MIPVILAFLWIIAAKVIAVFPSKDHHWRAAYILIGVGSPILVWLVWENGIWAGLAALLAGAWVLRWPVFYLWKRVRRLFGAE